MVYALGFLAREVLQVAEAIAKLFLQGGFFVRFLAGRDTKRAVLVQHFLDPFGVIRCDQGLGWGDVNLAELAKRVL